MKPKLLGAAVVLTWIAAALQESVVPYMTVFGARPDALLIVLAALSPFLYRSGGAVLGFALGVVHGGIAGANLMHYAISRSLSGFAAGWLNDLRFEPSLIAVFFTTAGLTVFAQMILMFLAPPAGIMAYLGATMITAVYNGVLVLPVYALLNRILDPVYR